MSAQKEKAYRYDLFITPQWRDRFDMLINENIPLPSEGRLLDVNCGTGSHAIEIAERMKQGEVRGVDPDPERIALAQAKAMVRKVKNIFFEEGIATSLRFGDGEFDAVICDASTMAAEEIESMFEEMIRVTGTGGRTILKLTTHGSFDEFFSIYWEALLQAQLIDETWSKLEKLINERVTISDAEEMASRLGLARVESFSSKEEFLYDTGSEFIQSPLIADIFLEGWLNLVPLSRREEVSRRIVSLIEEERHHAPFDISIKATVITGLK
ncbi:MAG: class I SAM-dependent methyltransferase [Acidobacteriota bacterium]